MEADFIIMGLPASGKTTFLAALWHLIESDETDCRLKLDRYEGSFTYLNQIAEAWRTFQKVPRTTQVENIDITLHLIDRQTEVEATVFFPDLAGETFDAQVEMRRCRPEFITDIAEDRGILFFISADVKGDILSVLELNATMPQLATDTSQSEPSAQEASSTEWKPKLIPSQVRVVQLLSDLQRSPFLPRRRRLAIMISAWDLTHGSGLNPAKWLADKMPLVDQFLRTNNQSFEARLYGVSAQGIRLDDNAAIDEAAKLTPSHRIEIVGPEGISHDLTSPLVWLMAPQ